MDKLQYTLDPLEIKPNDHTELLSMDVVTKRSPTMNQSGDETVEYTFKKSKGYLYKVVHLQSEPDQIMPDGNNINTTNTITPGQCQFYVISNQGDDPTTAHRTILPKPPNSVKTIGAPNTLKKRDERRRATHNEVERRRRDKINNWIMKLSKIIPDTTTNHDLGAASNAHYEGLSKGGILAKAFEYITELKEANTSLSECLKENEQISLAHIRLSETNERLRRDNELLRAQIAQHGIAPAPDTTDS